MKNIVLIGNGGHSKVIRAMIQRTKGYSLKGILDQTVTRYYEEDGIFYDNKNNIWKYKKDYHFVVAIGDNERRKKVIETLNLADKNYTYIVDETAIISPDVKIESGTVIMPNVVINPNTMIGKHTIINSNAVIEHDNIIGDYVHISPNATLAGTVNIKDSTHIGAGAIVIPNKTVFENVVVGAGAVVNKNLEKDTVAVGVPAKIIKRRSQS